MNSGERYRLLEKIAAGSFATVFRAEDLELRREVAVKQIHEQFLNDSQQLERYWGEAQLLASLQHPNIVTIYDIVREKGWLIMELMQTNLADRQAGRAMDLVSLRTVLAHSLRALKFLHEHGIVHGDIKPSNLMIDRRKRIKLGDFGLARRVSDEDGSLVKGTTKYMAPEVVSDEFGDVGPASDLYSLGFAAYELMCGEHFETLFPGLNAHGRDKQLAWIMWHAARDRRLPPIARVLEGVPDDLAKVIEKLSTKDPALRYPSADAALADLNVDLRVIKTDGTPLETPQTDRTQDRRRKLVIGAFACSMLLSVAILFTGGSDVTKPNAKSGLVRKVRPTERELIIEDEETGIPEVIKMGQKPSLLLTNGLTKNQKKILLEEVEAGDRIRVVKQGRGIEFVLRRPVETRGHILAIDEHAKVLTLFTDDKSSQRHEIPVHIGSQSKLTLNQREISFIELKVQDRVDILHIESANNADQQIALSVDALRTVRATGFVRSVNLPGRRMSFDIRQGATKRPLELPFSKTCPILLPDGSQITTNELKPNDLQLADRIAIEYDVEITKLKVRRNKTLSGLIKHVDPAGQSVIVQSTDGKQQTFVASTYTEIDIAGEMATLEDLRESDEIRVGYNNSADGKTSTTITIDATRPIKHDRTVLVIGVEHFADKSMPHADYVLNDVQLLADVLQHRYCVDPKRLVLLKNPDRKRIEEGVNKILEPVLGQTQVIVIFEGQAFEANGEYYLAAQDFQVAKPAETGLSLKWLIETLDQSVSREKLLVLDTFQVGNSDRVAPQPSPRKMLDSFAGSMKTVHAIAARDDNQRGQEWPGKSHGTFAWEMALAIRGAADNNRDLNLEAAEVFGYLRDSLAKLNFDKARPQTPSLFPKPDPN